MGNIALFRGNEFWRGFEDSVLERIGLLCTEHSLGPGAQVFEEGDKARFLYILKKGNVALVVKAESREEVIVGTVTQGGEIFGWSSLVEPYIMTASAVCLAATDLLAVPREKMEALFLEDPLFGYRFMRRLASLISTRLRDTRAQLVDFIS